MDQDRFLLNGRVLSEPSKVDQGVREFCKNSESECSKSYLANNTEYAFRDSSNKVAVFFLDCRVPVASRKTPFLKVGDIQKILGDLMTISVPSYDEDDREPPVPVGSRVESAPAEILSVDQIEEIQKTGPSGGSSRSSLTLRVHGTVLSTYGFCGNDSMLVQLHPVRPMTAADAKDFHEINEVVFLPSTTGTIRLSGNTCFMDAGVARPFSVDLKFEPFVSKPQNTAYRISRNPLWNASNSTDKPNVLKTIVIHEALDGLTWSVVQK